MGEGSEVLEAVDWAGTRGLLLLLAVMLRWGLVAAPGQMQPRSEGPDRSFRSLLRLLLHFATRSYLPHTCWIALSAL